MNWQRRVQKLQVDITSHCNAKCFMCVRNDGTGENSERQISLQHLDLELWRRISTQDTRGWYVRNLVFNGNWGDPIMHPDLIEILKIWIQAHPETLIQINTNAGVRSEKWWAELAQTLRQTANYDVTVAIDGTYETHHLYRVATDLRVIEKNLKAYTSAGGKLRVVTTMFKYNEHQLDEIKEWSRAVGAEQWNTRYSHGGDHPIVPPSYKHEEQEEDLMEHGDFTDVRDANYWIDAWDSVNHDQKVSRCPWYNGRKIQIDPWGIVWPCCHMSIPGSKINAPERDIQEHRDTAIENNNLYQRILPDILAGHWFSTTLKTGIYEEKWSVCQEFCDVQK